MLQSAVTTDRAPATGVLNRPPLVEVIESWA